MSKYPQVLLLGNGINQAYGGDSWSALLQSISKNDRIPKDTKLTLPMPLQAVLVTNDHVSTALKENRDNVFGKIVGS